MALWPSKKRQFPPLLDRFFTGFPRVFSALVGDVSRIVGKVARRGRFLAVSNRPEDFPSFLVR
jgi:hypothetical protein